MKTTELYTFKISKTQKLTLQTLSKKYKVNVSQFIRDSIDEKIERDNDSILKGYKEIKEYIDKSNKCPF